MNKVLTIIFGLFYCQINFAQPVISDSIKVIALLEQGEKAFLKNDTAKALQLYNRAKNIAKKNELPHYDGKASYLIGNLYYKYELYHRAFNNYSRARATIVQSYEEGALLLDIVTALAKTQYHRGSYRLSTTHFIESIRIARTLNKKSIEAESLEYLGLLYNSYHGYDEGTSYYVASFKVKKSMNDERGAVRVAHVLGETYYRKKLYDSAYYFANYAHSNAVKINMPTENFMAKINMVLSNIRLQKLEQAKKQLQELKINMASQQDENRKIRYEIAQGNYNMATGDSAQATIHYNNAKSYVVRNGFSEMYALLYKHMAESNFIAGNINIAYTYNTMYDKYVSQMYSASNISKLGSMENIMFAEIAKDQLSVMSAENQLKALLLEKANLTKSNLEKEKLLNEEILTNEREMSEILKEENEIKQSQLQREQQIKGLLEKENVQQEKKLRKERLYRLGLISGSALLLLSGLLLFRNYQLQKKKNAIILRQSTEMEMLMKEIHHRVKNNLQIVSSLLELQSNTISNEQASEAVRVGKNRVQSMALIHQNLYNEGNIKGIEVTTYIDNLVQSLITSYKMTDKSITIHKKIAPLSLDIDTMIPIGLIINELITNAFKHGFTDNPKPELVIELNEKDEKLHVKIADNGKGFYNQSSLLESKSFGIKMINAFVKKLKATINTFNQNGAVIEIIISKYKKI